MQCSLHNCYLSTKPMVKVTIPFKSSFQAMALIISDSLLKRAPSTPGVSVVAQSGLQLAQVPGLVESIKQVSIKDRVIVICPTVAPVRALFSFPQQPRLAFRVHFFRLGLGPTGAKLSK